MVAFLRIVLLLSLLAASPVPAVDFRMEGFAARRGESVREQAATAYATCSEWFGFELDRPVVVRWATEPQELRRYGQDPLAVAGLAVAESDLIVLSAQALAAHPDRIRPVLVHELCHLFVAAATRDAELLPPRWLNEGIAMWVSGEWDLGLRWQSNQDSLLRDAIAADGVLPFRALEVRFPKGPFFHVAYAQSLSFVEWMVGCEGEDSLRELLDLLDRDLDPEPAFERVYGMTVSAAEKQWAESFSGGGWIARIPSAGTIIAGLWTLLALLMIVKWVRVRLQLRNALDDD